MLPQWQQSKKRKPKLQLHRKGLSWRGSEEWVLHFLQLLLHAAEMLLRRGYSSLLMTWETVVKGGSNAWNPATLVGDLGEPLAFLALACLSLGYRSQLGNEMADGRALCLPLSANIKQISITSKNNKPCNLLPLNGSWNHYSFRYSLLTHPYQYIHLLSKVDY